MIATMVTAEPTTQTVILRNISWPLYRQLLARKGDSGNPRFAYNRGTLEIMMPSFEHEQTNRALADIFSALADELELDCINAGSTTFNRKEREQGFEPDTCFYIRHAEAVRGKKRIDLKRDPPPDLVIEIDITSLSLNKLPIFAGLGIPEVWRYRKGRLLILQLVNGEYLEQPDSSVLPGATAEQLTQFIAASTQLKRHEWLRDVREWAQTLKA